MHKKIILVICLSSILLSGCKEDQVASQYHNDVFQQEPKPTIVEEQEKELKDRTVDDLTADVTKQLEESLTDIQLADLISVVRLTYSNLLLDDVEDVYLSSNLFNKRFSHSIDVELIDNEHPDVVCYINEICRGYSLADEAIEEKNHEKLEEARQIYSKLYDYIPHVTATKEIMMRDIEIDFLKDYQKITVEEAEEKLDGVLVMPTYLPERFEFDGVYFSKDTELLYVVWIDCSNLEFFEVVQNNTDCKDSEGMFTMTNHLLTPAGEINQRYCWANHICTYDFYKNGRSVYGYMLVNDSNKETEYKKILESLEN